MSPVAIANPKATRSGFPLPGRVTGRMDGRVRRFGADRLGAGDLAALKGTVYLFVQSKLMPTACSQQRKVLDGRPMSFLEADIFILQTSAFCAVHHNLPGL
jgi:hypothetical protein